MPVVTWGDSQKLTRSYQGLCSKSNPFGGLFSEIIIDRSKQPFRRITCRRTDQALPTGPFFDRTLKKGIKGQVQDSANCLRKPKEKILFWFWFWLFDYLIIWLFDYLIIWLWIEWRVKRNLEKEALFMLREISLFSIMMITTISRINISFFMQSIS
jgi:hypothetical protein